MLLVENISHIKAEKDAYGEYKYKNEWKRERLAKFTSSRINELMDATTPFTVGGMSYILEKVGEELSGVPAKSEVTTDSTLWGLTYENDAIMKFGLHLGEKFLITQALIKIPGTRFASTPDCIRIIKDHGDRYEVETGEAKCYPSYPHFIRCVLCDTPQKLKLVDKKLYWQVIDQMENLGALNGWAILYHPDFNVGGFKLIKFNKKELREDFKFLNTRKTMAVAKFDELCEQMMNLKN